MSNDDWRAIARARAKELKRRHGTTQEEIAEKVGVSQGTLSGWLNKLRTPRLSQLPKLEAALDLPPGTLIASKTGAEACPYVAALLDIDAIAAALRGLDDAAARQELPDDYETRARFFARAYSLHILSDE